MIEVWEGPPGCLWVSASRIMPRQGIFIKLVRSMVCSPIVMAEKGVSESHEGQSSGEFATKKGF